VLKGDYGGELDYRGATGKGNPGNLPLHSSIYHLLDFFFLIFVVGGLVYGNTFHQGMQYHAWTSFISDSMFCIRACHGPRASELCNNIYDEMGCEWVRFVFPLSLSLLS